MIETFDKLLTNVYKLLAKFISVPVLECHLRILSRSYVDLKFFCLTLISVGQLFNQSSDYNTQATFHQVNQR